MSDPETDDEAGIAAALKSYFEGWFDGDPVRLEAALHPDLSKRGVRDGGFSGDQVVSMTAQQMVGWTRDGEGVRERPAQLDLAIEVLDIHRDMATAIVRSPIYIEYAHLVRTSGVWRVLNTVYMRRPTEDTS